MAEKVMPKELEQMMDRMFSVSPRDYAFFREQFGELIKTDEGSRLLRSLDKNFNGKKMNLITEAKPGSLGHCFDDESEIGIGLSSMLDYYVPSRFPLTIQREVKHGYPKLLFHELTHLEQYQKQAGPENAITDQDRYFSAIMCEADAQVSGDLFQMKLKSSPHLDKGIFSPAWQMAKLAAMIATNIRLNSRRKFISKTRQELQKNNPEWPLDQIEKETIKTFFKKSLLDKNSGWRRYYDNPKNRKTLGILEDNPNYPKKEFPDLMQYYMDKYGLTLDECLDLKKELLSQSNIKFPKQVAHSTATAPHQTNTQVLTHASAPREQPVATPKRSDSQKLDPTILAHLGRGGQGD